MAIQISGTSVIDNSRNLINVVGINASGIITATSDIKIGTKSVATIGKASAIAIVFGG